MRTIFNSRTSRLGAAILFTAAVYAAPGAAWAKDHSGTGSAVEVVSSTSFDGQAASDMKLEEKNGKSYLRIVFAAGQETRLIDVTRPEKAHVASNAGEERTRRDKNLVMVRMAAVASPDGPSSQEFTLWDISRSGHPRLVQKFSDVQRVIEDGRGYVYVLHHDGLAVIRSKDNNSNWPDMGIYG
jgi:hypothetical protein